MLNTRDVRGNEFVVPRATSDGTVEKGPQRLKRLLWATALVILAVVLIEQFELAAQHPMARFLMQTQDVPVLVLVSLALLALAFWRLPQAWGQLLEGAAGAGPVHLVGVLAIVAGIVVLGTKFCALGYAFSRDEAMVEFDAAILATGRLIATVPPEWRPFVPALQPEFRLAIPGDVAWVSSYLPGNAALRAVLGLVFNAAVTNAILMLVAVLAVFAIAKRLWPDRPDAWAISVLLLATSSQALFMAMTPYAMSAHLALNLLWLWLFLRDDKAGHLAAVGVGFVATGLHQIIFHPLFVAPFLLQVLLRRRWKLAAFYAASYAAIGLFWIFYWQLLLARNGVAPEAASTTGLSFFVARVAAMLSDFSWSGLDTMVQSLLRFTAWQNPLLLVLAAACVAARGRARDVMRPLAAGIGLTLLAVFILLPDQVNGWGYRYLHGVLGNATLLGAYGWMSLSAGATEGERRAAWGVVVATVALSMLVLLPIHGLQMRGTHAPYAAAYSAITRTKADAVIIDTTAVFFGNDLVRNDPFLRNTPKVFDIAQLDEALVRRLCSRFKVAMFDGEDAQRFGVAATVASDHSEFARLMRLRMTMKKLSCGGEPLADPD